MPRLAIRTAQVEYATSGSGDPVVVLHGSGHSGAQWRSLGERLGDRYRVVAPDLHGYGGTGDWPGTEPFSLRHEAELVCAVLDRVGGRAHLVGHSYGGAVALRVARLRAPALASLALVEPVPFHLLLGGDADDRAALAEITGVADGIRHALATGDYAAGTGRFVDYWNGPGSWGALAPHRRDDLSRRLPKIALDFHALIDAPDNLAELGAMTLPTLVVMGSQTPRPTARIAAHLARTLPHVRLETVAGAGHMVPLTHREAVNALLERHIEAHRPGPSPVRAFPQRRFPPAPVREGRVAEQASIHRFRARCGPRP